MTHPPDPALADSYGNWIFFAFLVIANALARIRGNRSVVSGVGAKVEAATKAEVLAIQEELKKLQLLRESDTTRSALMTERMNQLEGHVMELIEKISSFETALPQATEVLEKVLNTLERLKSGTLVDQPKVTGNVTFKEEKKPK